MNTKNILWAVLAILVFGSVWYLSSSSLGGSGADMVATTTPAVSTSTSQTPAPRVTVPKKPAASVPSPVKVAGFNSISYLLTLKDSLVCTIKTTDAYIQRSGTMYVAGGKVRGNFTNGSSMIDDGMFLYTWKTGASTGLKLSAAVSASGSAIARSGGLDPTMSFSFSCSVWTENSSFFVPPTSVVFTNTP